MSKQIVVGVCKLAASTPAAFCRADVSGTLELNANQQTIPALSDQTMVVKGIQDATLTLKCSGVSGADMALWFPDSPVLQIAAVPDFLVELLDGAKYVFTATQPGSCNISIGEGEQEFVSLDLVIKGIATEGSAGSSTTCVYSDLQKHNRNAVTITYGGNPYSDMAFALHNGMDAQSKTYLDGGATVEHMTEPGGYEVKLSDEGPTVVTTFEEALTNWYNQDHNYTVDDDTRDLVIVLDNKVDEIVTITCLNFIIKNPLSIQLQGGHNVVKYAYTFGPDSGAHFGRVTFDTEAQGGGS
jgi:hypothetical protein